MTRSQARNERETGVQRCRQTANSEGGGSGSLNTKCRALLRGRIGRGSRKVRKERWVRRRKLALDLCPRMEEGRGVDRGRNERNVAH